MTLKPVTKRLSVHVRVADELRAHIESKLQPGDRLDSESALASSLGVAVHTVREALSVLAHEGWVHRCHGSGTFVADRNAARCVAIMVGVHSEYPPLGYSATRTIEQLELAFGQQRISSRVYFARYQATTGSDAAWGDFQRSLQRQEVCGVVVVQGPLNDRWRGLLKDCPVPVVGETTEHLVRLDEAQMVREGVEYLLQAGRKKIAVMSGSDEPIPAGTSRSHVVIDAFRGVSAKHGLPVVDGWFCDDLSPTAAAAGYEEFREMWMAHDEKPDGLLICDDVLFADVAIAILELGIKVPRDLMVLTHANKGSVVRYPFPTVRLEYDVADLARAEADTLLKLIRNQPVAKDGIVVPFAWVGAERQVLEDAREQARVPAGSGQ